MIVKHGCGGKLVGEVIQTTNAKGEKKTATVKIKKKDK